jgi:hypothetical protein
MWRRTATEVVICVCLCLSALIAAPAFADLISPPPPPEPSVVPLTPSGLFHLAMRTMLEKGVAWILLGATAIVGAPWAIAGMAVVALALPSRFRRNQRTSRYR